MDNPTDKYSPFKPIDIKDRKWPNQLINKTFCHLSKAKAKDPIFTH